MWLENTFFNEGSRGMAGVSAENGAGLTRGNVNLARPRFRDKFFGVRAFLGRSHDRLVLRGGQRHLIQGIGFRFSVYVQGLGSQI